MHQPHHQRVDDDHREMFKRDLELRVHKKTDTIKSSSLEIEQIGCDVWL